MVAGGCIDIQRQKANRHISILIQLKNSKPMTNQHSQSSRTSSLLFTYQSPSKEV